MERPEFNDVVETLNSMFGNIISREVITAVVESCDGDLNLAAEAVMNMSSDTIDDSTKPADDKESKSQREATPSRSVQNTPQYAPVTNKNAFVPPEPDMQPAVSYAGASRSSGAVPKQFLKPRPPSTNSMIWTEQLRTIVANHNQGSRILILMRGLSGSGKTYLARQIVDILIGPTPVNYNTHIFSTDDFFMVRGQYQFQQYRLGEAHDWNQNRVREALRRGLSPVIVDNTNIEIWEMEPYVREGVRNGYIIEVVEPNTPWARKAHQLLKKTAHMVPMSTIKRKLESYQDGITGAYLKQHYGLSYPADKVPPVLRTLPKYNLPPDLIAPDINLIRGLTISESDSNESKDKIVNETPAQDSNQHSKDKSDAAAFSLPVQHSEHIIPIEVESEEEESARKKRYMEIQKQIEEMEKVEEEWEKGEGWDEESQSNVNSKREVPVVLEPRPPRRENSDSSTQSLPKENLLDTVQKCDDWRKISMFMPPWTDEPSPKLDEFAELPVRETRSTGTCVQVGDTDLKHPSKVLKVITATPRDINFYTIVKKEKIPAVRMLDKSTTTNELLLTEAFRCKNEEQHFVAFRKLFKTIPRASLRDIFDKCCGDVNWAVDIVLGGMADNQLELAGGDLSDTEEETPKSEQCNCLAAYQIVPDTEPEPSTSTAEQQNIPTHSIENIPLPQKKAKIVPSDSTLQLKRELEKNFVISDDHYSPHALKLRKWRRGENTTDETPEASQEPQPSTSVEAYKEESTRKDEASALSDDIDDDTSTSSSMDEAERTINVNVGFDFIAQLDELFGRRGMTYPENIVPKINIPISLLNEINAFWMESLMCQLDDQDKQNARMLQEDADFARQLEMKEAELAQQGREPEVPDFKEIMDMDFAISLYQKDVAEWRSKEPMDIAAKLSRDKLYNLFPDTPPEILSELLMAHDNNFQATVEVLLMSTGKAHILEEKNGLNKFVMEKEMERQEKLLEEEKKALSEVEWPLLPRGETVDLAVVETYRQQADKHLSRRNLNYQKAQDYIRRGMTQVANYYSDIASFHKQKYEQANSLAAASLMQVHASKSMDNATIDLHYLRVGEAKESLDLFLDTHIQKLRESTNKAVRSHTLFFITGRGLHSNGRPRVKPAVKKRLRERGLAFSERNPGLLTAKVTADDKLSYQLQVQVP
ncbi:AAA domain-containing protein [Phthorimaea operculella]|nr:AAA domain-containing protein [Phthorimaea operculella]